MPTPATIKIGPVIYSTSEVSPHSGLIIPEAQTGSYFGCPTLTATWHPFLAERPIELCAYTSDPLDWSKELDLPAKHNILATALKLGAASFLAMRSNGKEANTAKAMRRLLAEQKNIPDPYFGFNGPYDAEVHSGGKDIATVSVIKMAREIRSDHSLRLLTLHTFFEASQQVTDRNPFPGLKDMLAFKRLMLGLANAGAGPILNLQANLDRTWQEVSAAVIPHMPDGIFLPPSA